MSFANAITLTPSSGVATTSAVARVFDWVSLENQKVIRQNAAAGLATPQLLTMSHQKTGNGVTAVDRHLIRIDQTFAAAGVIPEQIASVYMVLVAPRNTVTVANMQDLVGCLLHQTNTVANLAKILNNEP
jgi:hypothetical protein